jgi:hypothetical protein
MSSSSEIAKDNLFAAGGLVYDDAGNGYFKLRGGDPNQLYCIFSDGHMRPKPSVAPGLIASGGTSGDTKRSGNDAKKSGNGTKKSGNSSGGTSTRKAGTSGGTSSSTKKASTSGSTTQSTASGVDRK